MSAINWATVAIGAWSIAISIKSIRINRKLIGRSAADYRYVTAWTRDE